MCVCICVSVCMCVGCMYVCVSVCVCVCVCVCMGVVVAVGICGLSVELFVVLSIVLHEHGRGTGTSLEVVSKQACRPGRTHASQHAVLGWLSTHADPGSAEAASAGTRRHSSMAAPPGVDAHHRCCDDHEGASRLLRGDPRQQRTPGEHRTRPNRNGISRVCVCVCVYVRERECVCVYVRVRVYVNVNVYVCISKYVCESECA
jgi:hypothetical protein